MKKIGVVLAFCIVLTAGVTIRPVVGQGQPAQQPQPLVPEVKAMYDTIAGYITKAADQFPTEKYGWQPTPEVRTWGRLIAHIIDDNIGACSPLAGITPRPIPQLETGTGPTKDGANLKKEDLTKMLAQAIDLCGKAFAAVNDSNMTERNGRRSKVGTLIYNTVHINEHYGNIVTYMRLQGMVPPSSQPK